MGGGIHATGDLRLREVVAGEPVNQGGHGGGSCGGGWWTCPQCEQCTRSNPRKLVVQGHVGHGQA
jgi:hypothetical protein